MEQNTTEYQLNILRNTQMVQRKQLEEMYPYLDWEKIPFSSYSDFFKLKSIINDCGEVWTNAYGRSNDEAEETRKYLKDYYAIYTNGYSANEEADLTIELLPDYGGALVSDGVDDYAVSDEVIDEEIGGVVIHCEDINKINRKFLFSTTDNNTNRLFLWRTYNMYEIGMPYTAPVSLPYVTFSRESLIPNGKLAIAANPSINTYSQNALYQLRLIKTQPTETQLEAIKWQCRKEHDDYLIQKGWSLQSSEETTN